MMSIEMSQDLHNSQFKKDCARRNILKFITNAKDEDVINDAIDIKYSLLELINHQFANCENEEQLKCFIQSIKTLFFVKKRVAVEREEKGSIEIESSVSECDHSNDEGLAERERKKGEKIARLCESESAPECVLSHMIMWL